MNGSAIPPVSSSLQMRTDRPTVLTTDSSCAHDWRVNPVVVATTRTGDCELWTCAKCGAQVVGPRLPAVQSSSPGVVWNDPSTWAHRV